MIVDAIRTTVSAALGDLNGLFRQTGPVYTATLTIDDGVRLPGGTRLLKHGTWDALVRIAPVDDQPVARTVCIKLPNAYSPGADQDFLLASSGDGVPWHHAVLPAGAPGGRLYSSLWLYLAGVEPVTFGARFTTDGIPGPGDSIEFLLSGLLSRFRRVGTLSLEREAPAAHVTFAAANCGEGVRALPPTLLYRG